MVSPLRIPQRDKALIDAFEVEHHARPGPEVKGAVNHAVFGNAHEMADKDRHSGACRRGRCPRNNGCKGLVIVLFACIEKCGIVAEIIEEDFCNLGEFCGLDEGLLESFYFVGVNRRHGKGVARSGASRNTKSVVLKGNQAAGIVLI